MGEHEARVVGLAIHWGGICVIAVLSFLMARSARRRFFHYWTLGWACLALSLACLLVAACLPAPTRAFLGVAFTAQYAFALFVLAGCRNHATDFTLEPSHAWVVVPASGIALGVAYGVENVNFALAPHAALLAGCWLVGHRFLRPARRRPRSAGARILSVALLLMFVLCVQYALAYTYVPRAGGSAGLSYLKYAPLYDLLLEILLAFGMVIVLMDCVWEQLEGERHQLATASTQLQKLVEKDPLSGALNRRGFSSFVRKNSGFPAVSGCAVLVDIDNFKAINDNLGHAVGDQAIQAVARAIRSIIRPEDVLFRWGGDEFLVLMLGVPEAPAHIRMNHLNPALAGTLLVEGAPPVDLAVSYGIEPFARLANLDAVIEAADRRMYEHKQARRIRLAAAQTQLS
jgi:diguanylate cyclase (GGDEF)-like protein